MYDRRKGGRYHKQATVEDGSLSVLSQVHAWFEKEANFKHKQKETRLCGDLMITRPQGTQSQS